MAAIRLVVADSAVPTTGDAAVKTYLEGKGHTVTYHSDETAVGDLTGIGLVIIAESCSSGTLGTKYRDDATPVLLMENGSLEELSMGVSLDDAAETQVVIIGENPVPHRFARANLTVTTSSTLGCSTDAGLASGATRIARAVTGANTVVFVIDTGGNLTSGTAPARRGFIGWKDAMWASTLNTDGKDLFGYVVDWLLDIAPLIDGFTYPGTVTTEIGPSGDDDWVNPGNISADDSAEAQITAATYDAGDMSFRLKARNFGFTITGTLVGIKVAIERRSFAGTARDNEVQLVNASGTAVGDNKASASTWPATTAVDTTYGGPADLWNSGLTMADLNSANFGVNLIVEATAANTDIGVDFIRVVR